MADEPIWIVTRDELENENDQGRKGWGQDQAKKVLSALTLRPVEPEKLKQEWSRTMRLVAHLIQQAEQEAGNELGMQLDEVTLSVEIDGKEQVAYSHDFGRVNSVTSAPDSHPTSAG